MDNKERLERKTIVWIIVVGLLAGLVILWLIPLDNRDLKFVFRTMNKNYSFEKVMMTLARVLKLHFILILFQRKLL